jgi:aminoglycoside phosphotransferase (APT) family kinase protein
VADLQDRLRAYAAHRLPAADEVVVQDLDRIFGGASRETYRFVLSYQQDGVERRRRLILRRDPTGSLIDTQRAVEFAAYRAFHGTDVPVPEPLWLEEDPRWLDQPFFVMAELSGFESSPQVIVAPPFAARAEDLARQKWSILGRIAAADPVALGLDRVMEFVEATQCWQRELEYWERRIDEDEREPQPIVRAAIRWLRRTPPPPPRRVTTVHGDYRTGNFLCDAAGTIHGILDWEMAHLGDPLEDLAWSLSPIWRWARDERAGGLAPRAAAIALWEAASGLVCEAAALRWWEVFSAVKGQAIWISGAREFDEGSNHDPILAVSSWLMGNAQDRAALLALGHLA